MENQELDNEKSLAIISEMIATTRNNISEDGFHFLLWGFILVICCLVQAVMIYFMNMPEQSNYVWLLMPLGAPISYWYGRTRAAKRKVTTFADSYYKYIWLGFGISLFCTIFLTSYYQKTPTFSIMVLTGFAVFASGIILKFKPLIWGAFVFWLGSLAALFDPNDAMILLVFAISIILGYIVPGFLLRKQFKNQSHVQTA